MPSIPSVPLMSARPSFGPSVSGSMPGDVALDHLALADQHERAVGERGEVAARAQRAELGHARGDPGVEQREDRLRDLGPRARAPHRQRARPQQHHRPHHLGLDRRPHAGGVRAHERALELRPAVDRDRHVGERAEAGGDAVGRLRAVGEAVHHGGARLHRRPRLRGQAHLRPVARDGDDVVGRESGAAELDHSGAHYWHAAPVTVIALDGRSLTPAGVVAIARRRAQAEIAPAARERNAAARRLVDDLIARGDLLYGVTTGVGALRAAPSALEDPGDHQWRLLRSHAGGGGAPLTTEVVRAAMAVRANQLGAGGAGVGERLLDALLGALRADVTPFARELGSLGTGDLTVLAEIGAALGGEGDCWVGDDVVPAADALAAAGLEQVRYGPRDGLAFMSSNAVSIGQAALVFHDASRLLDAALGVAALSYDATDADLSVLDPRVHAARPHRGQVEVARRLRELLGAREPSERAGRPVHDAFVFRCVPQVEGTLFEALERLLGVLEVELNVAGENALMLPADGVALPNGNFHAGVLTLALDSLRGAMAQSASLIAARVSALLDPEVTGLAPQLAQNPGPDSGAMILEYTAHAAAAEVRSLAATAASQTTTVQSGIESHANFAGHSARRTSDALARMSVAISAELVLAVRALRLRGRLPAGAGVRRLYDGAAARLDAEMADRPLSGDLEAARQLLFEDALWMETEQG